MMQVKITTILFSLSITKLQITLRLVVMFCKGGERGVRLWIERIMIGNSNKLLGLLPLSAPCVDLNVICNL